MPLFVELLHYNAEERVRLSRLHQTYPGTTVFENTSILKSSAVNLTSQTKTIHLHNVPARICILWVSFFILNI